jgi:diacylglycerol kinase (ATP)
VFFTLVKCRSYNLVLIVDGENIRTRALFAAVANGRYYGGGMLAAPNAELNDGIFDICIVKKIGRLKILKFFPKFIKGKHLGIPEVTMFRSNKVEINCSSEIILNIDGEVERVRKAVFEIVPKGIRVVVPQNQAFYDRDISVSEVNKV